MRYRYFKNYKIILTQLKKSGILINKLIYFNSKSHSLAIKKKNTSNLKILLYFGLVLTAFKRDL